MASCSQGDLKETDTWQAAADPANSNAWYNTLPKLMNRRAVKDFITSPEEFYAKDNPLYLPGAAYPAKSVRMQRPLFAIAINEELQPMDPTTGIKPIVKISEIATPSRTPLLLGRGMPGEKRDGATDPENYDGSPNATAKSFIGRHRGKGFVIFVDGRIDEFTREELLTGDQKGLTWRPYLK